MKPETAAALAAVNERFYREHASDFDGTRDRGWNGWQRIVGLIEDNLEGNQSPARPLRVLDLGCGNGRLALFLAHRLSTSFAYLGVDASPELLDRARARCQDFGFCRFERTDLLAQEKTREPGHAAYDVVTLFGLLHHVPGESQRLNLLEDALARTAPGGLLCLSSWSLENDPKFVRRRIEWNDHSLVREGHLDPGDLEAHDHILSWGGDPSSVRYCHHATEREQQQWIDHLPASLIDRYTSDGPGDRLNTYLVFRQER